MNESKANRTSWLPEGASELERVVDVVDAGGLALHRVGICARAASGEVVTGSAADAQVAPVLRAELEVLERLATLEATHAGRALVVRDRDGEACGLHPASALAPESDAPEAWRFARSNGVALHRTWAEAADRAWWELCERDHLLRSWYGEVAPQQVDHVPGWLRAAAEHDVVVARFDRGSQVDGLAVVGVFGFPRSSASPLFTGYAARPTFDAAVEAAASEAAQQLAFLWGEAIPVEAPKPGPAPGDHLEWLIWPGSHALLREWLEVGHGKHGKTPHRPPLRRPDGFVDLTPTWLAGRGRVARAIAADATPLIFGEGPDVGHLPTHLRLHPIP